jgi:hypothetical protein
MTQKAIARLLILTTFALAGAASAKDGGFGAGGFLGNGYHGRGFHKRNSPIVVDGFVDGYGPVGGGGYADYNGYGNGTGDWYGISPGHDECPLFHKRVMTPEGWRIQAIPVC